LGELILEVVQFPASAVTLIVLHLSVYSDSDHASREERRQRANLHEFEAHA
jgi:hypothetical protein